MKDAYKKIYIVCDDAGIPLAGQPARGYTLQQASSRHEREVREAVQLFGVSAKEADRWFTVINRETGEIVL